MVEIVMKTKINQWNAHVAVAATTEKVRNGRLTRREALRLFGGTGLAAAGVLTLGRRGAFAHQEATPPAAPTPVIGQQADGSTLWRVKVADMNMGMAAMTELHTFFPGEITVAVGDSIWFEFGMMPGFHTVTFLSGAEFPQLLIPDPEAGTPTAEQQPNLVLNPVILLGGNGGDYDGTGYLNSGADFMRDPAAPFMVRFTAPGSFDYYCMPHAPGMKGTVKVVEAGATLPFDQAAYDAASAEQIKALYDQAEAEIATYSALTETKRDDGTSLWEATVGLGESPIRVQAFLPHDLAIKVGDTVKWVNRSPGEPHTVSFIGAGEAPPEDSTVELFADGTPKLIQSMETFLPQGGNVFSGTGWVNSGFMGLPDLGLPMKWECTFDTPGEFVPYCVLHGDSAGNAMAAKLTVTPR
jgi:plastocyanin